LTAPIDTFRAIADPTRRSILDLLVEHERGVTEIGARFDLSQPAISQHLKVLRDAGLVDVTRAGKQQIYRVRPAGLGPVREWMAQYERFWNGRLDRLGKLLDAMPATVTGEDDPCIPPRPRGRSPRVSSTPRSASNASTPTRARRSGKR
jgi:DNA-binding transcriptional ArsR family regulator